MLENNISYNNKNLHYRAIGRGPLLILVHGFGEDGNIWNNQLPCLNDFRVLIPDLPGSGQSELQTDTTMETLAGALKYIMDHVAGNTALPATPKATMIGHSMGGYVTLAFAEKYPELLNGIGLFHSSCYQDTPEKILNRRKGIDFINEHGALAFLKTSIPNLYSHLTRENNHTIIQQQIDHSHNFLPLSLVCYYVAMMARKDQSELLKNITVPVLFILGTYDMAVPLQDGLKQCHLPDFSYIHILKMSGHMGMCEEPEKANEILYAFLKSPELTQ